MAKINIRQQLHVGARVAIAGLCWLASAGPQSAAEPLEEAAGGASFRLTAAESFGGREKEAGFDLGLYGLTGPSGSPTPSKPGVRGPAGIPTQREDRGELRIVMPEGSDRVLVSSKASGITDCGSLAFCGSARVSSGRGSTIALPAAMHDWKAQPSPADHATPAPTTGGEKAERLPEKPYGWGQLRFDFRYVARKPAHLDARERRGALAVAGTTALLYAYRKDIRDAWQENSSESRTNFLNAARFMGDGGFAPAVALATYLASLVTHNEREKETAQLVLESAALCAVGSGIGSFVLAVERPEDGDAIRFFAMDGHGVSFDVSLAASVIPPLRRQYLRVRPEDSTGLRILKHGLSALLYSGMAFTALQRIDADKHWAPDVFLGMVNGLVSGRVLGQAHDEAAQRRSRLGFRILPGGLAVTWTLSLDPR